MPFSIQAPLLFGLLAAIIASLGLIAVALRSDWTARQSGLFSLAAGGMLISLSLLHILPEALHLSPVAPRFILGGFLAGLLMTFAVRSLVPETADNSRAGAITPIIAVALHSFLDGVIYSVTFAASYESGVYASTSLIMHEFAEGVIAFAILARHGFRVKEALFWAFLAAAATTPLGVVVSGVFMGGLGPGVVGALYAVSAGLLIYVATGPLMQPLKEEPPSRAIGAFGAGILVAALLMAAPLHQHGQEGAHHGHGHSHGHEHDHDPKDPSGIHRHD